MLVEQGLSTIGFQAYSFPLTNGNDSKVTESDANIASLAAYTGMSINYLKGNLFVTASVTTYSLSDVIQDTAGRWAFCTTAGTLDAAGVANYGSNGGTAVFAAYYGEELIGSTYYAFNRYIDANAQTNTFAYERMQWSLRQVGDINDDSVGITAGQGGYGIVNGKVAELLGEFIGDTLYLKPGVLLRNFDANSTNNITHQPIVAGASDGLSSVDVPESFATVTFPFVAAGNHVFSQNFVDQPDVDTVRTVYFNYTKSQSATTIASTAVTGSQSTITDSGNGLNIAAGEYFTMEGFTSDTLNGLWLETGGTPAVGSVTAIKQNGDTVIAEIAGNSVTILGNPYESPGAIIVNDNSGTPIDGQITAATMAFDFDYTNNSQGGRTPDTNALCTVVAIAKDGAEWIDAEFTITKSTGINVPVNGGDERNYSNPA